MKISESSVASRRFGLGPRPGDLKRISSDPRGYVLAALADPGAARIIDTELPPSHVALSAFRSALGQRRAQRQAQANAEAKANAPRQSPQAGNTAPMMQPDQSGQATTPSRTGNAKTANEVAELRIETFKREAAARISRARTTDRPFLERLVMFWSNHFAVSALKGGGVAVTAGAFEREAIRPHVLGRFADMLKAVEQHPAMLLYLDNATSFGPSSRIGRRRSRGLNENLAREILELHTLGTAGGYSQADVTSFAKVITGWSIAPPNGRLGEPGRFVFNTNGHEPGKQTVLGKIYPDQGLETGERVLADLARHPSTARHISSKLARHFLGDDPPPSLVERLDMSFRDTDGDLSQLARTLASAPECWQNPPRKILPPYDFAVALMRGFTIETPLPQVLRMTAAIGQPLWRPPSPKGWPDEDDAWTGPSAIRERLRITERIASQAGPDLDPREAARDLLGESASSHTLEAVRRAETRQQALELLCMSPEYLRR